MKIKGAILDMDGTLLDSMHVWRNYVDVYLGRKGLKKLPDPEGKLAPLTLKQAAEMFQTRYGITDDLQTIENEVNSLVEEEYFYNVQPKEGVREMLEEFKKAGVRMCIATATDKYLVEAAMKRLDLIHYFDNIFTCGELNTGKGEPFMFEYALKSLGTPKDETFVFEDSFYAIDTAKKAGFKVAAVYDEHSRFREEQIREMVEVYLKEVPEWRGKFEF